MCTFNPTYQTSCPKTEPCGIPNRHCCIAAFQFSCKDLSRHNFLRNASALARFAYIRWMFQLMHRCKSFHFANGSSRDWTLNEPETTVDCLPAQVTVVNFEFAGRVDVCSLKPRHLELIEGFRLGFGVILVTPRGRGLDAKWIFQERLQGIRYKHAMDFAKWSS